MQLHQNLFALYEGNSRKALLFRYALLALDAAIVLFVIASSFFGSNNITETIDILIGFVVLADFSSRILISRDRLHDIFSVTGIADIIVIISLIIPMTGEGFAFLRVVRTLRLLRSYQFLVRLRGEFTFFRRNETGIFAAVNLLLFIFVTTAIVFETQHLTNPDISNYADALYFTVTTLTTTGFGDITLPTPTGRLLSVAIMIFGVSLFIRLVQVLLRPPKVAYECPSCGLQRHDSDAVHCKHCGRLLHISTEGNT